MLMLNICNNRRAITSDDNLVIFVDIQSSTVTLVISNDLMVDNKSSYVNNGICK